MAGNKSAWIGLALGPLLCMLCLWALPAQYDVPLDTGVTSTAGADGIDTEVAEFSWAGRATLGIMVWMGVWWLTEAIHISATALLPIVIFPLFGVASITDASAPYADPLIFLYLGGFIIALSMERWGLGKRTALLTLSLVGTSGSAMVGGFMLVTAVLSAFVSNTATTAMMLPIALSVIALVKHPAGSASERVKTGLGEPGADRFAICLLLAIAYSASVGGIATIIGTPTNVFLIGFLRDKISEPYRYDFSFVSWLPIGLSLTVVFLPLMFWIMTRLLFPLGNLAVPGGKRLIESELRTLGAMSRGEWNTLTVFFCVVLLWLFRPLVTSVAWPWGEERVLPFANLSDTGIAMLGAILLFIIPTDIRRREFTMNWETAEQLPWGILLLFGGGLSLAAAVQANGVAEFLGSQAGQFRGLSPWLLVLFVVAAIVFLTELTSNAATTASLVPVLAALAPGVGVHPYLLAIPATVAASCAFMLPVATPPNAIVFGSRLISVPQMMRAGIALNLLSIVLVTLLAMLVVKPWMGI